MLAREFHADARLTTWAREGGEGAQRKESSDGNGPTLFLPSSSSSSATSSSASPHVPQAFQFNFSDLHRESLRTSASRRGTRVEKKRGDGTRLTKTILQYLYSVPVYPSFSLGYSTTAPGPMRSTSVLKKLVIACILPGRRWGNGEPREAETKEVRFDFGPSLFSFQRLPSPLPFKVQQPCVLGDW